MNCISSSTTRLRPRSVRSPAAAVTLYLTPLVEVTCGGLHQPPPLPTVTVTVGEHLFGAELREVCDQPVVEKAHVLRAARGGQLLEEWQLDALHAWVGHFL